MLSYNDTLTSILLSRLLNGSYSIINYIISIKNDKILDTITSTAEHNIFLILAITRQVGKIQELSKMTLGILGYGRLGKLIYNICKKVRHSRY